jgi:hypothetical protein
VCLPMCPSPIVLKELMGSLHLNFCKAVQGLYPTDQAHLAPQGLTKTAPVGQPRVLLGEMTAPDWPSRLDETIPLSILICHF